VREAFAPSAEQSAWAGRVLEAAKSQPGVFAFEGRMVDQPILDQARRMLGSRA
jgi:citrate lyase subunit beta/citryl-CoA lyase